MENSISNESIWGKLSDMDKKLGKIQEQQIASQSSNQPTDESVSSLSIDTTHLESLMAEKLEQMELTIAKPITQKLEHRISVDIKSSWVSVVLFGLVLSLIVAGAYIYKQRERIETLADNDLKYRYIKAYGSIDSTGLYFIEDKFTYNRDVKLVSKMRKDIESFEQKTRERAEKLEQARLKIKEAEKLTKEVEGLRKK